MKKYIGLFFALACLCSHAWADTTDQMSVMFSPGYQALPVEMAYNQMDKLSVVFAPNYPVSLAPQELRQADNLVLSFAPGYSSVVLPVALPQSGAVSVVFSPCYQSNPIPIALNQSDSMLLMFAPNYPAVMPPVSLPQNDAMTICFSPNYPQGVPQIVAQSTDGDVKLNYTQATVNDAPVVVSVNSVTSTSDPLSFALLAQAAGMGLVPVSQLYDLGPDGTIFSPPATMTFQYSLPLPEGINEADLFVYRYHSDATGWEQLADGIVRDAINHTITVQVDSLCKFAIFAHDPSLCSVTGTCQNAVSVTASDLRGAGSVSKLVNSGSFTVENLVSGVYGITLLGADGMVYSLPKRISLPRGCTTDIGTIQLPQTMAAVSGEIGLPLPGITVAIGRNMGQGLFVPSTSTVTSDGGAYSFTSITAGEYTIKVLPEGALGFVPAEITVNVSSLDVALPTLPLQAGTGLYISGGTPNTRLFANSYAAFSGIADASGSLVCNVSTGAYVVTGGNYHYAVMPATITVTQAPCSLGLTQLPVTITPVSVAYTQYAGTSIPCALFAFADNGGAPVPVCVSDEIQANAASQSINYYQSTGQPVLCAITDNLATDLHVINVFAAEMNGVQYTITAVGAQLSGLVTIHSQLAYKPLVYLWDANGLIAGVCEGGIDGSYQFCHIPAGSYSLSATDRASGDRAAFDPIALADGQDLTGNTLNIEPIPPVTLDHIAPQVVDEGQQLSVHIPANDPGGRALTYTAANLPPGAVLDQATESIIWTPTYAQAGVYPNVAVQITDAISIASTTFTITVREKGTMATVRLIDSNGAGIAGGVATYAGSSWQALGTTDVSGNAQIVLSTNTASITVKMTYGGATLSQVQNIRTNPVFIFHTVKTRVQLHSSTGGGLPNGAVTYAGSSWLNVGTTDSGGEASVELLPTSYTFKMTFAGATLSKIQDVSANPLITFQTVKTRVQLHSSTGGALAGGVATYAGSSWLNIGTTDTAGETSLELLPTSYTFKMTCGGATLSKVQDVSTNALVAFQTIKAHVQLHSSTGGGLAGGVVTYAGSSWLSVGTTDATGETSQELLPTSYTFKMTYAGTTICKVQDVTTNPLIVFQTVKARVQLHSSTGSPLSGGVETYAGSSWLSVGTTDATGEASQELLTASYTFRVNYAGATLSKVQDIGANPLVVFNTVNVSVTLADAQGQLYAGGIITYAGSSWLSFGTSVSTGPVYKELLPTSYTFRMVYAGTTTSKVQDVSQNQAVGFLK